MQHKWVQGKVDGWVHSVTKLAQIAKRYPQAAYAGFSVSLQSEWQHLSRALPGAEAYLQPVEDAICAELIPALLQLQKGEMNANLRRVLSHRVKQGGMNIRNPVESAPRQRESSVEGSKVLVASLLSGAELNGVEHATSVRTASAAGRKARVEQEAAHMATLKAAATRDGRKKLERRGLCGGWLSARPSITGGTLLSREEFVDNARLRYGFTPLDLCQRCDGCGAGMSVEHALNCKKGGLVGIRHNDVRDEAGALAELAFPKTCVSYEPYIFYGAGARVTGQAAQDGRSGKAGDEARGDVMVHGLWKKGESCILDVRVTDTDAKSYRATSSAKVLERAAREKKGKYEQACLDQRRSFMPLIYSVDGMRGKEAEVFEKRIAALLSQKWSRAYSALAGWVKVRMALAVVRSNTMLLRGSRRRHSWRPEVEDGVAAGMEGTLQDN